MSLGVTDSLLLSSRRWCREISLMERSVLPPSLRARSAITLRHGENLIGVLVQKQVIVAKMAPAHVPVEVLRLHIKRKYVGK